ncbi:MAG: LPD7 domain-containing protein [Telluria sp.]
MSGPAVVNASGLRNCDSVTKSGTIIYRVGASAVRDDGDRLRLSSGADRGALIAALHMASGRFGERLNVTGGAGFREDVVQATVAAGLKISFVDAALERRRQQLMGAMRGLDKEVSTTSACIEPTARLVLAVDDATARRFKRLRRGAKVSANSQGLVLKKGRRR